MIRLVSKINEMKKIIETTKISKISNASGKSKISKVSEISKISNTLSQQVTTRHQQTELYESITKQDRNNITDQQKKHRLGTFSKKYFTDLTVHQPQP